MLNHGAVAAEIPAHAIAEEGPRYERPIAKAAAPNASDAAAHAARFKFAAAGADLTDNFRKLLASPTIASKKWVTGQYDSMVRTNTRVWSGSG